jgi:hypothetical protein
VEEVMGKHDKRDQDGSGTYDSSKTENVNGSRGGKHRKPD